MGVINTEPRGPSVGDVMIFGRDTFPTKVEFPCVRFYSNNQELTDTIYNWCSDNFGNDFYYQKYDYWHFTYQNDATLFRLTWINLENN